jgi:CRP-like cAMP-binding protein
MNLTEMLKNTTVFGSLAPDELQTLSERFKTRTLKAGELLFNLGDPGDYMVLVQDGQLAIFMPESGRPEVGQPIRIFQDGEILGEMALIDRKPRSTSARAETDCAIATLDLPDFLQLVSSRPEVAMAVMGSLSGRIRYTTDFIGEVRQWVNRLGEGKYESIQAPDDVQDTSLAALAADFVRMAAQVQAREEKLKKEVAELRIQIDEKQRREKASEITDSEYFRNLKSQLKAMRDADDDED